MSKIIDHLETLHNNPFIFSPIFSEFYKVLGDKPQNALLAYLVLPLVLYPESKAFLTRANSRSSLRTMLDKSSRIYGLSERIFEYREITNVSLQHAIDNGALDISQSSSFKTGNHVLPSVLSEMARPASKLGILFAPYDVPTIFRTLGVKKL